MQILINFTRLILYKQELNKFTDTLYIYMRQIIYALSRVVMNINFNDSRLQDILYVYISTINFFFFIYCIYSVEIKSKLQSV